MTGTDLTLRPSMRTEAVWLGTSTLAYAIIFIPFVIWLVVQPADPESAQRTARVVSLGAVLVLVLAVNAVVLGLARKNRAVFVNETELGEITWFGTRHAYPRSRLGEVRRLAVRHKTTDPIHRLIVTDTEGHRLLDLRPQVWNEASISRLCTALGVEPVGSFEDVVTHHDFAAKHPVAPHS